MTTHTLLRCPRCGTDNRVPVARLDGRMRPVCGRCRTPLQATPPGVRDVGNGEFARLVGDSQVPVLVDCWAPWCAPCRAVAPVLARIASRFGGALVVAKLNVDENPHTAAQYGIGSIPTLLLFRGGQLVDRLVGAHPEPALLGWLHAKGIVP